MSFFVLCNAIEHYRFLLIDGVLSESSTKEGTALLEDSFCAGRCGQQRHNTGHTAGDCALPPPQPSAPLSTPASPSAAVAAGEDADVVAAWACAGGRRAERAYRCRSVDPEACSALHGASAPWCVGASARRRSCASTPRRPGAPAPGASAVCAPLPEWQGHLGARPGNRITARQTKAAAVRGQQ